MIFDTYFLEIIEKTDKLHYDYVGINRKEFPKWEGWKIISKYKENGVDIKEIRDARLETMVRNFYYLKFISEKFSNN